MNNQEVVLLPNTVFDEIYGNINPYSDKGYECLRAWCKDTGTFFYARPDCNFSMTEAYDLCQDTGLTRLLVTNLS